MRKVTMVRLGIAAAITALGAAGAMASGCSSDDNAGGGGDGGGASSSSGGSSGSSSGTASGSSSGNSSGSSSGSSSGDAGPPPANLVIVHAAPGLGPFRVCFASGTNVEPLSALPDGPGVSGGVNGLVPPNPLSADGGGAVASGTPGIYPGTIGAFPNLGTSLEALQITPYIVDSSKIASDINYDGGVGVAPDGGAEESCLALIGSHGAGPADNPVAGRLTEGVDYWKLPQIPANTLLDGKTYLLSITGCLPGFQPSATEIGAGLEANPAVDVTAANICGPSFDGGAPNIAIGIQQLDTTTAVAADAGIGVQFTNLSTAIQGNPFIYPLESGGSVVAVYVHPPASTGVIPGIPGETVTLTDGGLLEDGGAAPPIQNVAPNFSAVGPASTVGSITPVAPVPGLPFFNADGGAGPAYFGALTTPGSAADGGAVLAQYPVYPTGNQASPLALGDQFALPLSGVYTLSGWSASTAAPPPGYFANGQTYTFVLLGSNDVGIPQIANSDGTPNAAYDGRGLHIVAFPNTFTPKSN